MKKRILFVDDEESVLTGLGRLLRPMRNEWDMEFVSSGATALKRMAEAPFDVIVSDMRMPGMNGAELLNEVMRLYPKTIRLILSGYADRETILKCVGSTHQYLSKPCEGDALKATILRATQLEDSLKNDELRSLVARCSVLPTVPALYSQIVEALEDPEVDTDRIGTIIAKDGAVTARILKLVNSAFFGHGREIADPADAVAYLGTDTIKSLVLFDNAFSPKQPMKVEGFSIENLSKHALQVANAAKVVASYEAAERKLVDEAYVAGLLHDVGILVFAANLPQEYQQTIKLAREEKLTLAAAEKRTFAADHADVGGFLLGLWGLPVPVVEAIALHHHPGIAPQKEFAPLTALHVGNALAAREYPSVAGIPTLEPDHDYLISLGLEHRLSSWRRAWENRDAL